MKNCTGIGGQLQRRVAPFTRTLQHNAPRPNQVAQFSNSSQSFAVRVAAMASKIIPKDVVGKVRKLVPEDPVGTAKSFLQKVVKPWAITGPTATSEFLESVPQAKDYRKISPASIPVRPAIPHAETDKVFDIKYHTRDRKRSVKTTVQEMDPVALAAELEGLPPTPGNGRQYVMGTAYHMDDEPNEGYQK